MEFRYVRSHFSDAREIVSKLQSFIANYFLSGRDKASVVIDFSHTTVYTSAGIKHFYDTDLEVGELDPDALYHGRVVYALHPSMIGMYTNRTGLEQFMREVQKLSSGEGSLIVWGIRQNKIQHVLTCKTYEGDIPVMKIGLSDLQAAEHFMTCNHLRTFDSAIDYLRDRADDVTDPECQKMLKIVYNMKIQECLLDVVFEDEQSPRIVPLFSYECGSPSFGTLKTKEQLEAEEDSEMSEPMDDTDE
jgi:hypothetical protein